MRTIRKYRGALAALLCLLAVCLLLPCAAAEGAEKEELTELLLEPDLFGQTWYAAGDLPTGVEVSGEMLSAPLALIREGDTAESIDGFVPRTYGLELVSGNPALAEALQIREKDGFPFLELDPAALAVPGEAVFRLTMENDKYTYQQEHTLKVESFRENPPFIISDVPLSGRMRTSADASSEGIFKFYIEKARISGDAEKAWLNTENPAGFLDNVPGFVNKGDGMYQVTETGIYDFRLPAAYSNVAFELNCRMTLSEDYIRGDSSAVPGESLPFIVTSSRGANYTWGVTGEGASISREGLLTVKEDTPEGTLLLVTATPEDGGVTVSQNVFVEEFGFASATVEETISYSGIQVPVLGGRRWQIREGDGDPAFRSTAVDSTGLVHSADIYFYRTGQFVYDDATAEAFYQKNQSGDMEYESREIRIDGMPAALYTFAVNSNGADISSGIIDYARNNTELTMYLFAGRQGSLEDGDMRITLDYLEKVASHIHYDEASAYFTYNDVRLTVETDRHAAPVAVSGKNLQMKASFGNPDKVNKKEKNDEILWSITDAEGLETTAASVTNKGLVTVAKNLEEPVALTVTATSGYFGVKETMEIMVIPAAAKIETDPAEINLYEGSDRAETVRAAVTPGTIPLNLLRWTMAKEGFAEMTAGEDGTASFKALKAGKTTATVTEPGGRKATLRVNVLLPVEDVELRVTGKQVPGGTVAVKATTAPKNAGKKDLEWSLDVGEDIATINNKGQVKIAKTAPAGTMITVTCKALGAPEPVVKTVTFEVAEK